MSDRPQKVSGWAQGLYEVASDKREKLGCLRITEDGRKFRYAYSGEALAAGKNGLMLDGVAHHVEETGDAMAKGATRVSLVVGATAVTANQYQDGYLQIYDGAAGTVGHQYLIRSNTACGASGTTVVQLEEPIRVAVISTDTWSLIANPFGYITQQGSLAHGLAGIVPNTVAASKYFWIQTGGVACALNDGGTTLGAGLVTSGTEGALKTQPDGELDAAPCGQCISQAATTATYNPVYLQID